MILFINACVKENSRTKRLADYLISKLDGDVTEVKLEDIEFPTTDEEFLNRRDELLASRRYDDESFAFARQFAEADTIVIAAPYWDLSFPASLKHYVEHINAMGITFEYTPEGFPSPLCKAQKLYYVMTAGGGYVPEEFGFGYIKELAVNFYGIKDVQLIKANGLDIVGADIEEILRAAECDIDELFS